MQLWVKVAEVATRLRVGGAYSLSKNQAATRKSLRLGVQLLQLGATYCKSCILTRRVRATYQPHTPFRGWVEVALEVAVLSWFLD